MSKRIGRELLIAAGFLAEGLFLSVLAFETDVPLALAAGTAAFLAADFLAGLLAGRLLAALNFLEGVAEFLAGEMAVHDARAVELAFDLLTAREMLEVDARRGLVDFLAAMARAPDEFLKEIRLMDSELFHAPLEGGFLLSAEHGDNCSLIPGTPGREGADR